MFDQQLDSAVILAREGAEVETVSIGRNGNASFDTDGRVISVEVFVGAAALGLPDVGSAARIVERMERWHRDRVPSTSNRDE